MRKNFTFDTIWNGEDNIEFHAEVAIMPESFKSWPSLEITKMMEAKMPLELVTEMKEEAAEAFRSEGATEEFIRRRLRIPSCGIAPDEEPEQDDDFTEKDRRREGRIRNKDAEKLRASWQKSRINREKVKRDKKIKRDLRRKER